MHYTVNYVGQCTVKQSIVPIIATIFRYCNQQQTILRQQLVHYMMPYTMHNYKLVHYTVNHGSALHCTLWQCTTLSTIIILCAVKYISNFYENRHMYCKLLLASTCTLLRHYSNSALSSMVTYRITHYFECTMLLCDTQICIQLVQCNVTELLFRWFLDYSLFLPLVHHPEPPRNNRHFVTQGQRVNSSKGEEVTRSEED